MESDYPIIPKHVKNGITPLKITTQRKPKLVGFDTETVNGKLYSIQISYRQKNGKITEKIYYPSEPGIHNLLLFPRNSYIYAHFLEYDLQSILGNTIYDLIYFKRENLKYYYNDYEIRSKIAIGIANFGNFKFINQKTNYKFYLKFRDTLSFFHFSLSNEKAVQKYAPVKKVRKPPYLGLRAPKTPKQKKRFERYAKRDATICLYLAEKIYDFHRTENIPISTTASQFSALALRKKLDSSLPLQHPKINQIAWKAYAGGRTECIVRGLTENVTNYDNVSLYPYAGSTIPLPVKPLQFISRKNTILDLIEDGWHGFSLIDWKYDEDERYPAIHLHTSKLIFPLNSPEPKWRATPEITEALKEGCEITPHSAFLFYPSTNDIENPIKHHLIETFKLKQKASETGNDNMKSMQKLKLNGLIGKLIQRVKDWMLDYSTDPIAGGLWNPVYASLILSQAKAKTHHDMHYLQSVYTDTDGYFSKKRNIRIGKNLGDLHIETTKNGKPVTGDIRAVRAKLYFVSKHDEPEILLKTAKHSFWISDKETYRLILQNLDKSSVNYYKQRIIRTKEAYRRHTQPLLPEIMKRSVDTREDKKRLFFKKLTTFSDIFSENTDSTPLKL